METKSKLNKVKLNKNLNNTKNNSWTQSKTNNSFFQKGIEFNNVSVNISNRKILSDISLKIPQNSNNLIVGHIGAGKTSLIHSLTGFYKIKLRGIGIRIVYKLIRTETQMIVVVIGMREDEEVYEIAARRIKKHDL